QLRPSDEYPLRPEIRRAVNLLETGDVSQALPLLEFSAAFLLYERLERRRKLTALRSQGGGMLVDEYVTCADFMHGVGTLFVQADSIHQIDRTLARLNELTTEIRAVPGLEDFLLFPTIETLTSLNYHDSVLYLLAGPDAGWGVILEGQPKPRITQLHLPEFTLADAR